MHWLEKTPLLRWYARGADAGERFRRSMTRTLRVSPRVFGVPFESVDISTRDGLKLSSWYVPGDVEGPHYGRDIAVVLHHHFGGQKATLLPWLDFMRRQGLCSVAFDARGHGASQAGLHRRDCFVRRAADVHAACEYLRQRGHGRLLIVGQSQGAAVAVIAAAQRDDVAGIITDCGPAPSMELATWGMAEAILEQGRFDLDGRVFMRAILALRLLKRTRPLRYNMALWTSLRGLRQRRLLWVHGEADEVISQQWSAAWFRALAPKHGGWSAFSVPNGQHVRSLQQGGAPLQRALSEFIASL